MTRTQAMAAAIGLLATLPALAQGPAAPAATPPAAAPAPIVDRATRLEQIDAELKQQNERRASARGGFIAAGVVMGLGIVISAVRTVENQEEAEEEAAENGESEYEYKTDYAGTLVGALIALPIALGAYHTLEDVNARTRELHRERYQLGLAPAAGGGTMLTLRYDF